MVEETPGGDAPEDLTRRTLQLRIRQQEILAELGVFALQRRDFIELLDETAQRTAEGLEAEFCKVLEYQPDQHRLLVRAGVGWDPGVIGHATVGADSESPAGFALVTGKPVISNHLENEERFRTPELLVEHGIRRAANVILQGNGAPYGVLEVDSRSSGEFVESDLTFLQGAANILGMAIERQRFERDLASALERYKILLQEMNHRVKNSLQVVASMLRLQANADDDPDLQAKLLQAAGRAAAVGRAYERLTYDGDNERVDLGTYLRSVVADIESTVENATVDLQVRSEVRLQSDRAILVGLIVNELVTNAAKHAYPEDGHGVIHVDLSRHGDQAILSVRDEGTGLPADFEKSRNKRLGFRLVGALSQQLEAELTHTSGDGTVFRLSVPLV